MTSRSPVSLEKVPEGFAKRPPGQPARRMLSGDVPFDMLTGMSAIHCATERAGAL